jgi:predicted CxxxxCH...CXXCH cytochrome family protein
MKTLLTSVIVLVAMAFTMAGCNSGTGPDSLSTQQTQGSIPISSCTEKCHNASSTISPDPLVTNGTGTYGKHIAHVQNTGIPCEKCHANYINAPTHMNGMLDTGPAVNLVFFDSTNPPPAQFDKNAGPPVAGICSNLVCHGSDALDWYGTGTANFQDCGSCHSFTIGTRRRVTGTQGDFGGNASIVSHHVTTTGDPAREQCLVCHDQSTHTAGTVRLRHADGGAAIVYSAASPTTLEPFCLSCHDTTGAASTFVSGGTPTSPFNDGSTMGQVPNRASVEIKDAWNKTYGHRQKGLTCIGDGTPNTGCHGNGHGTANVGLLARNLTLPNAKTNWYNVADEPDYDICFTCHAAYSTVSKEAILGMKAGGNYATDLFNNNGVLPAYAIANIQTLFRDVNLGTTGKAYDDPTFFSSAHENLHMYHLQIGPAWNYRDSIPSSIVCVSCHSVHGSNTQWGWVHDELQFSHFTVGADQYGMIGAAPLSLLGNYPTSCTFNCHDMFGPTHSWFEPSDE